MTDERLTSILAERVMGWRVGPDRYITVDRQWIKRERFQPARSLDAALRLVNALQPISYNVGGSQSGCWARIQTAAGTWEATAHSMSLALCLAIARAQGIDVEELR